MNPTKLLQVMIACNQPDGHFSGYLTGFDLGELQMECVLDGEGCELSFDGNYLKVGQEKFYIADHKRHVPNQCWDYVAMPAETVVRFLNWTFRNHFDWNNGPTAFVTILDDQGKIGLEHLDLLY